MDEKVKITKSKFFSILEEIKKDKIAESLFEEHVMIVDGNNLVIRTFASLPNLNENGHGVGAIIGSLKSLAFSIRLIKPSKLIIVFDGKGGSKKRREIFPEYKEGRKTRSRVNRMYSDMVSKEIEEESLIKQMARVYDYFNQLPCKVILIDDIEADDTIAYLTKQLLVDSRITIMSTDKDFLQLVDNRVSVWSPTKKKLYTPDIIRAEYKFSSNNFILFRIMDGDKSDNVDGIPYAGPKVIAKNFPFLCSDEEKTLDDLLHFAKYNLANSNKFYQKVLNSKDLLERNYKLMQLKNVDIANSLKLNIINIINAPVPRMNKIEIIKMMESDRIINSIPYLEKWLYDSFNVLDMCARESNEKLNKK